jgi:hypothetical protein
MFDRGKEVAYSDDGSPLGLSYLDLTRLLHTVARMKYPHAELFLGHYQKVDSLCQNNTVLHRVVDSQNESHISTLR